VPLTEAYGDRAALSKCGQMCLPIGLDLTLRPHFLKHRFNPADDACEEGLH